MLMLGALIQRTVHEISVARKVSRPILSLDAQDQDMSPCLLEVSYPQRRKSPRSLATHALRLEAKIFILSLTRKNGKPLCLDNEARLHVNIFV